MEEHTLPLSKIGDIKAILHGPLPGPPKTMTVRRQSGKWFACIACEFEASPLAPCEEVIGIDVGIEKFAALSNGELIENPH